MSHDDISSSTDKRVHRTKAKNGAWVHMGIRKQQPARLRKIASLAQQQGIKLGAGSARAFWRCGHWAPSGPESGGNPKGE
jgi:hypothetical protein